MVDLVHGALATQRRRVGMQLAAREIEQLEPVVELFVPQIQGVGRVHESRVGRPAPLIDTYETR